MSGEATSAAAQQLSTVSTTVVSTVVPESARLSKFREVLAKSQGQWLRGIGGGGPGSLSRALRESYPTLSARHGRELETIFSEYWEVLARNVELEAVDILQASSVPAKWATLDDLRVRARARGGDDGAGAGAATATIEPAALPPSEEMRILAGDISAAHKLKLEELVQEVRLL